jgi:hypothetical protein
MERKYSVAEIDRMRILIMKMRRFDTIPVEERLRTYMLNGSEPEELEQALVKMEAERSARRAANAADHATRERSL